MGVIIRWRSSNIFAASMGSQFFSSPYDRDGSESLERLIGRDWDGSSERDNDCLVKGRPSINRPIDERSSVDFAIDRDDRIIDASARQTDLIVFENDSRSLSCGNFIDFGSKINASSSDCEPFSCRRESDSDLRAIGARNRIDCVDRCVASQQNYRQIAAPILDCSDRCSSSLPATFDHCQNRSFY